MELEIIISDKGLVPFGAPPFAGFTGFFPCPSMGASQSVSFFTTITGNCGP